MNPRPPGWCWVDSSAHTHVVRCERCDKNYGVFFSKPEATAFAKVHRHTHAGEEEFEWAGFSPAPLIKNPGGRPRKDKGTCEQCSQPAHARGLCQSHYARAYREGLKEAS